MLQLLEIAVLTMHSINAILWAVAGGNKDDPKQQSVSVIIQFFQSATGSPKMIGGHAFGCTEYEYNPLNNLGCRTVTRAELT